MVLLKIESKMLQAKFENQNSKIETNTNDKNSNDLNRIAIYRIPKNELF